jgi:hypothetical protein
MAASFRGGKNERRRSKHQESANAAGWSSIDSPIAASGMLNKLQTALFKGL